MAKSYKSSVKCPICGGQAALKTEDLKLSSGKIVLKGEPYYRCSKCKEKFSTSEQVKEAEKNIRAAFHFTRRIVSTGRSLAVTLPPDLTGYYKLGKGKKITLVPESEKQIKILLA